VNKKKTEEEAACCGSAKQGMTGEEQKNCKKMKKS